MSAPAGKYRDVLFVAFIAGPERLGVGFFALKIAPIIDPTAVALSVPSGISLFSSGFAFILPCGRRNPGDTGCA